MAQGKETGPVNWIKARADCNLDLSFDALRSVVQRDVGIANDTPSLTAQDTISFAFQHEDQGVVPTFIVRRTIRDKPAGEARFAQHPQKIEVDFGSGSEERFSVSALWDAEHCKCRLLMDGKPCEIWEISRRALEWLFFGENG